MNILVVDDEPIMREAYVTMIDWEKNGFTLVGSAKNGSAAMKIMHENEVDIVITDLKMPVMSGLELIRKAHAEFPKVKFIVVSGFDDFQLVKDAFALGVKEYFLKFEMEPETILQTLFKVKQEIEDERILEKEKLDNQKKIDSKLNEAQRLEKLVQNNRVAICEKLLKELVWGTDVKKAESGLKECKIYLDEKSLSVMVFSLNDYYLVEEKEWLGQRELFKYAILNVLDEICKKYGSFYPFYNLPHEFVVIYSSPEQIVKSNCLKNFFEDVHSAVIECFGMNVDCGLSTFCGGYDNLKTLYTEAQKACSYGFVAGHGKMVAYKDMRMSSEDINISQKLQELKRLLAMAEAAQIKKEAYKLRVSSNDVGYRKIDEVKRLFSLYYAEMTSFLEESGLNEYVEKNIFEYTQIKETADLGRLNNWLVTSVCDIADTLENRSGINKAKSYIKHHYSEQISLSTVADVLEISTGHLSRMFQKSEGESFTQYLLKTRINAAIYFLQNTNLKVYEVAKKVGYPNAEQFSKMFKKVTGKSPKAFIK